MNTTPEQLQAWREKFEKPLIKEDLTRDSQYPTDYQDREIESNWIGYLRRCQETELEAQLADAKSQWIPVSKRLSENNTRVFVINKFGQRDMADVYEGAFENCWDIDDADETITHWMSLPKSPKDMV